MAPYSVRFTCMLVLTALLWLLNPSGVSYAQSSNSSQLVTWTCTGSPCPWGASTSGQALVWPAELGASANRLGYTVSAGVYLPAAVASGVTIGITSGMVEVYAGLPDETSHRLLATLSTGQLYVVPGLAAGEVVSAQGSSAGFDYTLTVPATPVLSVTNAQVTFNGAPQAANVVGSVPGTPSNIKYNGSSTVPTDADIYAVTADFTPTDTTNYRSVSDASVGSFTIAKATTTTTVSCTAGPFTYTGAAITPCTAVVTGAGGLNQALTVSYTGNTNAGSATASASYAGNANHLASSDEKTFTIAKATTTTTVSCTAGPFTYTGAAITPCTAVVTGAGGLNQALTVSYTGNTNAGSATASASYAGNANHLASNDEKTFTIAKAATTTTVSCAAGPFTYTGAAITPCTAVVTGAGGLNQALTVSYTGNTNAGSATASASYAGNANHLASSDEKTFTIAKATTTTTVSCTAGPFTYTGAAITPCTAVVTGAGGLNQALTVSYTGNTNAGSATASASYAGNANHLASSDEKTFTIAKAATTTTVSCAAGPFTYTGAAITPCTAVVTGAGGLNQALTVSYTGNTNAGSATASASYAGSANHLASNDSDTFIIGEATIVPWLYLPYASR